MSWEKIGSKKYPCKCGKDYYIETMYMDDWNRTRETYSIECNECRERYNLITKSVGYKSKHGHVEIMWEEKVKM